MRRLQNYASAIRGIRFSPKPQEEGGLQFSKLILIPLPCLPTFTGSFSYGFLMVSRFPVVEGSSRIHIESSQKSYWTLVSKAGLCPVLCLVTLGTSFNVSATLAPSLVPVYLHGSIGLSSSSGGRLDGFRCRKGRKTVGPPGSSPDAATLALCDTSPKDRDAPVVKPGRCDGSPQWAPEVS